MHSYNGKFVPMVHLLKYKQNMEVVGATKEVMCKYFSMYLTYLATLYFCRLDLGLISY